MLFSKLKNLKIKVKQWAREKYGKYEKCIDRWEDALLKFDLLEEDNILSDDQMKLKHEVKVHLATAIKDQDRFWSQRTSVEG